MVRTEKKIIPKFPWFWICSSWDRITLSWAEFWPRDKIRSVPVLLIPWTCNYWVCTTNPAPIPWTWSQFTAWTWTKLITRTWSIIITGTRSLVLYWAGATTMTWPGGRVSFRSGSSRFTARTWDRSCFTWTLRIFN